MPDYRIMYSKKGPARYISHLDLLRTFARAGRRAGLPLAFTQGFNPHPKISFAAPLGVGIIGEAEYADIELKNCMRADSLCSALSCALPEGLQVLEARAIPEHSPSLMAAVDRAAYRVIAELDRSYSRDDLRAALKIFLDLPELWLERQGKKGVVKKQNIRPGIFVLSGEIENDSLMLNLELKAGSSGNVRCEDVLDIFQRVANIPIKGMFDLSRTGIFGRPKQDNYDKQSLW